VNTSEARALRQKLKNFKHNEEKRKANRRLTAYGQTWNNDNTRRAKDIAEQARELSDRREVEEVCCANIMAEAKKVFYKNGDNKNPWSSKIANTMFWM